jgi:hypothetical protein
MERGPKSCSRCKSKIAQRHIAPCDTGLAFALEVKAYGGQG